MLILALMFMFSSKKTSGWNKLKWGKNSIARPVKASIDFLQARSGSPAYFQIQIFRHLRFLALYKG